MTPFLSTESSKAGPTGGLLSGRFTLMESDDVCRGNDERTLWCLVYGKRCRFHNGAMLNAAVARDRLSHLMS